MVLGFLQEQLLSLDMLEAQHADLPGVGVSFEVSDDIVSLIHVELGLLARYLNGAVNSRLVIFLWGIK